VTRNVPLNSNTYFSETLGPLPPYRRPVSIDRAFHCFIGHKHCRELLAKATIAHIAARQKLGLYPVRSLIIRKSWISPNELKKAR
jgi:hypothetical protein